MYPKVSFPFTNIYYIFDIWRGKRYQFVWMDERRWWEVLYIIQCKSSIFQKTICSSHRCNTLILCFWLRKFPLFIEHHGPAQGRGHHIMYLDFSLWKNRNLTPFREYPRLTLGVFMLFFTPFSLLCSRWGSKHCIGRESRSCKTSIHKTLLQVHCQCCHRTAVISSPGNHFF